MDELCHRAAKGIPMDDGTGNNDLASTSSSSSRSASDREEPLLAQRRVAPRHRVDDGDVEFDSDLEADVQARFPDVKSMTIARLTAILVRCLDHHSMLPAALGARATSLPHKARALLHSLQLESQSSRHLDSMLRSTISITTDLGTEFGLADCSAAGWWPHFSTSTAPSMLMQDELGHLDDFSDGMDGAESRQYMFGDALPVAG